MSDRPRILRFAPQTVEPYHQDGLIPGAGWVWVFGSNTGGRHGKGAAAVAHRNFGARYGVGCGRTGNAYAIPTKNARLAPLSLSEIKDHVDQFLAHSANNLHERFFVTRIGRVPAGYSDEQIAPMFATRSANCSLPTQWQPWTGCRGAQQAPRVA